eukprot:51005-Alexandrium_andersonii.AAC.1
MHRLARPDHARRPPSRGSDRGGGEEADAEGSLGVRREDLPLAVGAGCALLAEHPLTASSWEEDCAKLLMDRPEVQRGVGHMR